MALPDAGADPWTGGLFAGARWWTPDEEAAAQALRYAIDGRDRPAASVRERLAAAFTRQHATGRLMEILIELHAGQRLPS